MAEEVTGSRRGPLALMLAAWTSSESVLLRCAANGLTKSVARAHEMPSIRNGWTPVQSCKRSGVLSQDIGDRRTHYLGPAVALSAVAVGWDLWVLRWAGLSRDEMASLVARDIPPGAFVNLGIGQPTRVSNFIRADRKVMLHTENGMLGMGPLADAATADPDLINAGKELVTEVFECGYPLTGPGCVSRVYTDHAVFDIGG